MVQTYGVPKCPYCMSLNIEPIGVKSWQCRDCGKLFPEAVVEATPPIPKKGGKK